MYTYFTSFHFGFSSLVHITGVCNHSPHNTSSSPIPSSAVVPRPRDGSLFLLMPIDVIATKSALTPTESCDRVPTMRACVWGEVGGMIAIASSAANIMAARCWSVNLNEFAITADRRSTCSREPITAGYMERIGTSAGTMHKTWPWGEQKQITYACYENGAFYNVTLANNIISP